MAFTYKEEPIPVQQKLNFSIDRFGGVNVNGDISSSEFSSCKNMSGDNFPYASPRASKEVIATGIEGPQRLFFCGDKLSYIAGGKLYVSGLTEEASEEAEADDTINFGYAGDVGDVISTVDFNNQKMLFYPTDMVYDYQKNTVEQAMETLKKNDCEDAIELGLKGDFYGIILTVDGSNDNEFIHLEPVMENNQPVKDENERNIYPVISVHCSEDDPCFWEGHDNYKRTLFVRAWGLNGNNEEIEITEALPGYDYQMFEFGEKISYDGYYATKLKIYVGYCYSYGSTLMGINGTCLEAKEADYNDGVENDDTIKYWISPSEYPAPNSRPPIKYACMDNNRVVGVEGNNYYASCLGDYADWTDFVDAEGNPKATGAYAEELYTYGDFTGIVKYSNYVFMTKADMTYICQGNKPPYRINEVCKTGCIDGNSIAEVDGYLYWLGREGVYRFGGGTPLLISQKIGTDFTGGAAVCHGHKYYISTKGKLYSYNTQYGFWHIEDDREYISLTSRDGKLYGLTASGEIVLFESGNERVKWEFVTRRFDFDTEYTKNLSKVYCRLKLFGQANVDIYIKSNKADWFKFASYKAEGETVIQAKVKMKKYDYFQLKFVGVGEAHIMDIYADCVVGSQKHRARNKLNVYKKG